MESRPNPYGRPIIKDSDASIEPYIGAEIPELVGTEPERFPYLPADGFSIVIVRAVDISGAFIGQTQPVHLYYINDGDQPWIELRTILDGGSTCQYHVPVYDDFDPALFKVDASTLNVTPQTLFNIVLANAPKPPDPEPVS